MSDSIAVLLPCYNEAPTLAATIEQMRGALPNATIYVFDNNSTDGSGEIAREAGAEVRHVRLQGKGNVIRRMFADVDADVYLMTDADTTYDPSIAPELVYAVHEGADMAIGVRKGPDAAFPPGHKFGNWLFNVIVSRLFGHGMEDIFSGYRAFSRRYAKSFPAHSHGFEIETEMCIFALEQRLPFVEIPAPYGLRPEGSHSKLNKYRDGLRILFTIMLMYKDLRPMRFFGLIALVFAILCVITGAPVFMEWADTGKVDHIGIAILATAFGTLAVFHTAAGIILHGMARVYRETRHLFYLNRRP